MGHCFAELLKIGTKQDSFSIEIDFPTTFNDITNITVSRLKAGHSIQMLDRFPNLQNLRLINTESLYSFMSWKNTKSLQCEVGFVDGYPWTISFAHIVQELRGITHLPWSFNIVIRDEPSDVNQIDAFRRTMEQFTLPPRVTIYMKRRHHWNMATSA
jgi:hypothetical protein